MSSAAELTRAKELMAKLLLQAADQEAATAKARRQVELDANEVAKAEASKASEGAAIDTVLRQMTMRGDAMAFTKHAARATAVAAANRLARLEERKLHAAGLFRSQRFTEAAQAYTSIIASSHAAQHPNEAAQALPGLLANRSVCWMEDGTTLEACVRDCSDALSAIDQAGPGCTVSPFKIRLRRAEANRRLGNMEECCRQSSALSSLAKTDDERAAAGYLALNLAIVCVE